MPFSRPFPPRLAALWPALLVAGCATTAVPPPAPPLAAAAPAVSATPAAAAPAVADTARSERAAAAAEARAEARAESLALARPPDSPVLRPTEGNVSVLAYADRLRSMAPGELTAEIARLGDLPDSLRSPFHDLQMVLALAQTRAPQDLQRAQGLLQKILANTTEDARRLQPMARLLAARFAEQRRVEDALDRQNQQVRDLQRRIDQLNDRLEAVRAIERSLTRPGGNGAPAAKP
ncbi:hypothetical protein [uncultured Xylophilus sp.]|uniref:hypothetical protein n=1 Tax=uncultured Xylophilus sp. TaxID=296832 RepID=UPI0025D49A57|nr:hypothetical protein [uncultured Xylophilus sp.]